MKWALVMLTLLFPLAWGGAPEVITTPLKDATPAVPDLRGDANWHAHPASFWSQVQSAWDGVGTTLATACRLIQGQPVNIGRLIGIDVTIPVALRATPELEFICEAHRTQRWLNGVLFQDWRGLAGEIAGQWIGDVATGYLTAMGIEAGSADWASAIERLQLTMKQNYRSFMRKLRNAVWDQVSAELDRLRAHRQRITTITQPNNSEENIPKRIAVAVTTNPVTGFAEAIDKGAEQARVEMDAPAGVIARESEALPDRSKKLANNFTSAKTRYTAPKPISSSTGSTQVSVVEELKDAAQQAPDTRTAVEVAVRAITEQIKTSFLTSQYHLQALQEIVNQQALTNQALASVLRKMDSSVASARAALDTAALDQAVEEAEVVSVVDSSLGIVRETSKSTLKPMDASGFSF